MYRSISNMSIYCINGNVFHQRSQHTSYQGLSKPAINATPKTNQAQVVRLIALPNDTVEGRVSKEKAKEILKNTSNHLVQPQCKEHDVFTRLAK